MPLHGFHYEVENRLDFGYKHPHIEAAWRTFPLDGVALFRVLSTASHVKFYAVTLAGDSKFILKARLKCLPQIETLAGVLNTFVHPSPMPSFHPIATAMGVYLLGLIAVKSASEPAQLNSLRRYAAFVAADFTSFQAQSSHGNSALRSLVSTVAPAQIRNPAGASR